MQVAKRRNLVYFLRRFEMKVEFFGGYDSRYPRNAVLRRGLALNGIDVAECRVRPGYRFWLRYPLLLSRWPSRSRTNLSLLPPSFSSPDAPSFSSSRHPASVSRRTFLLVPEFCQKDVPLAKLLALLGSRKVIFDPLASRFETKFGDWRWRPEESLAAWWNRAIDRWAFRLSDLIIADTLAHRDYYCREFELRPEKIAVVPVGFDDRIFKAELSRKRLTPGPDSPPFIILFFGSFLPLHGVETVIEAARWVAKEDASIQFELIGSGQTFDRVQQLASDLKTTNIRFIGWMEQDELAERIAARADVCLGLFGRTEKAGRVVPHKVFQSMALGKAVVTARTPAAEEFFTHCENIFFCNLGEPEPLARAILELRRDSGLRERIARKGYELVWEKFHPGAIGAALRDALIRLIQTD
jgi:glycosyltransferase involved in cell wall biosynthesis